MKDWIEILKNKSSEEAIGEIIESYHNRFIFQTYSLENLPEYASFVVTFSGNDINIGIVTAISIKPIVSLGDIPKPFKRSRLELTKDYKDIMDKYRGICEAISIGYIKNNEFFQGRPQKIPLIHDLVFIPEKELIKEVHLANNLCLSYLPLIYNALPSEERNLFSYFLESFFKKMTNIFTEEELLKMFEETQRELLEKQFENLYEQVNISFRRIFEK